MFFSKSIEDIEKELNTNISLGLSNEEVIRRQKEFGFNELKKVKRESFLLKFFKQFKDLLVIILLIASVLSGYIDYINNESLTNTYIILAILFVNSLIGAFQEEKAQKSLEELNKIDRKYVNVIRNGLVQNIDTREVVVGDIVNISAGEFVCADMRIIEAHNLSVSESSLNGESEPVLKDNIRLPENTGLVDRKNMLYNSTFINNGRAKAIVVATSEDSEIGKISNAISKKKSVKTPLEIRLNHLGMVLANLSLIICLTIFVIGLILGKSLISLIMLSISLAVAAIPEGLVAIATIVQAIGVKKLAKENILVKKLSSVETLGSTSIICTDKTGTLTINKMKIQDIIEFNKEELKFARILCNDCEYDYAKKSYLGDPTEIALIQDEKDYLEISKSVLRIAEIPFNSENKFMITINKNEKNEIFAYIKGGFSEVLKKCNISSEERKKELNKIHDTLASDGKRIIAFGYSKLDSKFANAAIKDQDLLNIKFEMIGLISLIDPPREDAKASIELAKKAGIKIVMITGDHKLTAKKIASDLGIIESDKDLVITGKELEMLSDKELEEKIYDIKVYARVSPSDKLRIVNAFQKRGEIVAMTGDGINDAPSLKHANIGCAMGLNGTDVAKEAADLVILDDKFSTIIHAIYLGRTIYANIKKSIHYLISSNIGELVLILLSVLCTPLIMKVFNLPSKYLNILIPLLPIQILLINLVTDSLLALALSVDKPNANIMKDKPNISTKMFGSSSLIQIGYQGIFIGIISFASFIIGINSHMSITKEISIAQTMTFLSITIMEIIHIFNIKAKDSIFKENIFNNAFVNFSVILNLLIVFLVISLDFTRKLFKFEKLSLYQIILVCVLSSLIIVIEEIGKYIRKKNRKEYNIIEKSRKE